MSLNGCFEPVDGGAFLDPADRIGQRFFIDDRADLLVMAQLVPQIAGQGVLRELTDSDDCGARTREGARKLLLVGWKTGFYEDYVHFRNILGAQWEEAPGVENAPVTHAAGRLGL